MYEEELWKLNFIKRSVSCLKLRQTNFVDLLYILDKNSSQNLLTYHIFIITSNILGKIDIENKKNSNLFLSSYWVANNVSLINDWVHGGIANNNQNSESFSFFLFNLNELKIYFGYLNIENGIVKPSKVHHFRLNLNLNQNADYNIKIFQNSNGGVYLASSSLLIYINETKHMQSNYLEYKTDMVKIKQVI